jgi:hypothetical protein
LFLLLQTFAKWLGFLQKLQVFPGAEHLLACGKLPPQLLHVVLFLGFDSVCVSKYRGLFRRLLKFCFLMAFADLKSVSACSISVACFSEISRALDLNLHVKPFFLV